MSTRHCLGFGLVALSLCFFGDRFGIGTIARANIPPSNPLIYCEKECEPATYYFMRRATESECIPSTDPIQGQICTATVACQGSMIIPYKDGQCVDGIELCMGNITSKEPRAKVNWYCNAVQSTVDPHCECGYTSEVEDPPVDYGSTEIKDCKNLTEYGE